MKLDEFHGEEWPALKWWQNLSFINDNVYTTLESYEVKQILVMDRVEHEQLIQLYKYSIEKRGGAGDGEMLEELARTVGLTSAYIYLTKMLT